jgi:flagellar hook protein FlgE
MPFRIALSGLNAAATDLRVIGNNVANVGTTGFKESRTEFSDVVPASNLGTAANVVGSGVQVSAVAQQFSQGNLEFTDNSLDLAISGQGFFRLNDSGSIVYSRAGAFGVDRDGFVVNAANQRLTVFEPDGAGNITGALGDLRLDTSDIPPGATGTVTVTANLDANDTDFPAYPGLPAFDAQDPSTYSHSTSLTVYDSLGNPLLATMYFRKTDVANVWEMHLRVMNGAGIATEVIPAGNVAGEPALLTFDGSGVLTAVNPPAGATLAVDYQAVNPGTGAVNLVLDVDVSSSTQFGSGFSVNALAQDGYSSGRLSGISVDRTGVVQARYSNGQTRVLGQVAIATFRSPQGLQQLGDTTWAETFGSGSALTGTAGTGTLGLIQSGALEGSNVDLTEQLVKMITAQRNFQANAQVISTADTITQTVINIR